MFAHSNNNILSFWLLIIITIIVIIITIIVIIITIIVIIIMITQQFIMFHSRTTHRYKGMKNVYSASSCNE